VRLPASVDKRRELVFQVGQDQGLGIDMALWNNNEVHATGQGLLMQTEEFAQKALDAIAPHRRSQFPAYGHAEPPGGIGRGVVKREKNKLPGIMLLALLVASKKLGAFA